MILTELNILNYRNIREASMAFAPKLNCLIGLNGQGKTNVLDAIYMLSFTKSAYTTQDSLNITHDQEMAMVQGVYKMSRELNSLNEPLTLNDEMMTVSCGLRRGVKKQFRRDRKDYKRLIDHIGLIPLVMVSPADHQLIEEGSDERRRFMDSVISQLDKPYLEHITRYSALLKQRNALLKQYQDAPEVAWDLFEVLEEQMIPSARYIFSAREQFISRFVPIFQELYDELSGGAEQVSLIYQSQLHTRDLRAAYLSTRQRDLILGWTSQGVHKDELQMMLGDYPLKRVASQGQQKTYLLTMKLAQALYISQRLTTNDQRPILLLDDIFDKLDSERVARIVRMVKRPEFGQIFITDTDRQHLTDILRPDPEARIFCVADGQIQLLTT
ncbi:MAG: DNA replication and repair protein RecF [Paludibacteraceae bacterium]|nr:DNA replication and repair protein RecF [Paludibacteraceae bacterium]